MFTETNPPTPVTGILLRYAVLAVRIRSALREAARRRIGDKRLW